MMFMPTTILMMLEPLRQLPQYSNYRINDDFYHKLNNIYKRLLLLA